ncbi:AMP-binding protein [Streptomyces sp. XM4193]|uniref:class I adenylate-forming enzyme family protein n=1 Tax=Streptomyces sp. XM4193 TaxID=2929782 RepID=UPI001FF91D06|nr:AMP-binding protein [Streptomyces sp. XM4193]MCK1798979.1 AMP-binding protein [Streptomyces sp. XM4193]
MVTGPAPAAAAAPTEPADLVDLLDRAAELHGSRPAVRDATGSWTWSRLSAASRTVADRLAERGVEPGARVLSLLRPGREFAALLFGVLRAGCSLVPARPGSSDFELSHLLSDARPVLVAVDDDVPAPPAAGSTAVRSSALLCDGGRPPTRAPRRVRGEAEALLLYTSGSTGRPKGIVCPHRAVVFAARAIAERLGYQPHDVVWNRLPLSFDYGLHQFFLCALAGAELVLPPGELSADEPARLREAGASVLPLVPAYGAVLARLAQRDPRPTRVRLLTNTGAALVGADAARVRAAFPGSSLVCMYGMTECKRITVADPDEDLTHPGTVGRALPGTRLFVVDDRGRPQPPGTVGQIVSAGPHVMAGYRNAPEETARRFGPSPDGDGTAVHTGDTGRMDPDGRLWFLGRSDDIFKHRGWRMSTLELETALLDVPGVRSAAAAPPDAAGVLTVWAATDLAAGEVLRALVERLGAARAPDRCVVLAELPRTAHGKVDREALRSPGRAR